MTPSVADPLSEEGVRTDQALPRRPRRRVITGPTMAVLALVTCAIGFYAGIRVEKSHASGTSGVAGRFAAAAATGRARGATSGTAGGTATPPGFAGAGAGGFARAGAAGGTAGTVASVNGKTLVLTETGGATVKVKLTPSTAITKTQKVGRKAVRPGDTISVTGASAKGTVTAASITDSGDTSTTSSSASSGSSTSGTSSGSAGVRSLFGG